MVDMCALTFCSFLGLSIIMKQPWISAFSLLPLIYVLMLSQLLIDNRRKNDDD